MATAPTAREVVEGLARLDVAPLRRAVTEGRPGTSGTLARSTLLLLRSCAGRRLLGESACPWLPAPYTLTADDPARVAAPLPPTPARRLTGLTYLELELEPDRLDLGHPAWQTGPAELQALLQADPASPKQEGSSWSKGTLPEALERWLLLAAYLSCYPGPPSTPGLEVAGAAGGKEELARALMTDSAQIHAPNSGQEGSTLPWATAFRRRNLRADTGRLGWPDLSAALFTRLEWIRLEGARERGDLAPLSSTSIPRATEARRSMELATLLPISYATFVQPPSAAEFPSTWAAALWNLEIVVLFAPFLPATWLAAPPLASRLLAALAHVRGDTDARDPAAAVRPLCLPAPSLDTHPVTHLEVVLNAMRYAVREEGGVRLLAPALLNLLRTAAEDLPAPTQATALLALCTGFPVMRRIGWMEGQQATVTQLLAFLRTPAHVGALTTARTQHAPRSMLAELLRSVLLGPWGSLGWASRAELLDAVLLTPVPASPFSLALELCLDVAAFYQHACDPEDGLKQRKADYSASTAIPHQHQADMLTWLWAWLQMQRGTSSPASPTMLAAAVGILEGCTPLRARRASPWPKALAAVAEGLLTTSVPSDVECVLLVRLFALGARIPLSRVSDIAGTLLSVLLQPARSLLRGGPSQAPPPDQDAPWLRVQPGVVACLQQLLSALASGPDDMDAFEGIIHDIANFARESKSWLEEPPSTSAECSRLRHLVQASVHPLLHELWRGWARRAQPTPPPAATELPRTRENTALRSLLVTAFQASHEMGLFAEHPEDLDFVAMAVGASESHAEELVTSLLLDASAPPNDSVLGLVTRLLPRLPDTLLVRVRTRMQEELVRVGSPATSSPTSTMDAHHDACVALAALPHLPDTRDFLVWYAGWLLQMTSHPEHLAHVDSASAQLSRLFRVISGWGMEGRGAVPSSHTPPSPARGALAVATTRDILDLVWRKWSELQGGANTGAGTLGVLSPQQQQYLRLLVAQLPHVPLPCLAGFLGRLDAALCALPLPLPRDLLQAAYDICTDPLPIDYVRREALLHWYLRLYRRSREHARRARAKL